MQAKHSRILGSIISRLAFDAERNNHTDWLCDRLFLRVMSSAGCRAERILASLLKEWEIHRIKSRIARRIDAQPQTEAVERGTFFETLTTRLMQMAEVDQMLDTAHVLCLVMSDPSTISKGVLEMYGVTVEEVTERMLYTDADEDNSVIINSAPLLERSIPITITSSLGVRRQERTTLERFSTDMTAAAERGDIDAVVGRDVEIERLIQILGRRKKNNPVLVGQAGVGKSSIVEGVALRIVAGQVPRALRGKRVLSLDLAALVAGTKYRGEFEERMNQIIEELRADPRIIIFIDEIHTIVGAGSTQGSLDAANILKPALARGELQCVGATTLDEYRENIERDAALERRFQKILVEPTTPRQTLQILRKIAPHYERHHSVRYTREALRACVELTDRYVSDRYFPDKAIDVMDEAGARAQMVAEGQQTVEIGVRHIEQIITLMTGIPMERVSQDEMSRLVSMRAGLEESVIGQTAAVDRVVRSIVRSRTGLKDPSKPIGVFMFVGPTGVGKTHLAEQLARRMFDRDDAMIRIDMSEYGQAHNVSRLIGSPPGYVGYGEGGQLTEAVRLQPYSVVLFDEVEKAHRDVFSLMLQLLDDGVLTDGLGRRVDFKNTIIIMTSNLGSHGAKVDARLVGYHTAGQVQSHRKPMTANYRKALEQHFAPEFINRLDDIVVFNRLSMDDIERIVDVELRLLCERAERLGYRLDLSPEARRHLAELGYEPQYGVRSLKRKIMEHIEEPLAQMIVEGRISPGDTVGVEYAAQGVELLVKAA
ncbi:MAG: ATP-dependent Clp protease ATP-binding subunit [Rikenellaceae bacterium]|nr:ATP-dependent Clp protease ATP-binding subunit [Rikenellaceae bacterium]